jgi:hypothetical protein
VVGSPLRAAGNIDSLQAGQRLVSAEQSFTYLHDRTPVRELSAAAGSFGSLHLSPIGPAPIPAVATAGIAGALPGQFLNDCPKNSHAGGIDQNVTAWAFKGSA